HRQVIGVSDGTAGGSVLLPPGSGEVFNFIDDLTALNGKLYFDAETLTGNFRLWVSDGTSAGTVDEETLAGQPTKGILNPADLTVVNGALYFSADITNADDTFRLIKEDGSGPVEITALNPNNDFVSPEQITGV